MSVLVLRGWHKTWVWPTPSIPPWTYAKGFYSVLLGQLGGYTKPLYPDSESRTNLRTLARNRTLIQLANFPKTRSSGPRSFHQSLNRPGLVWAMARYRECKSVLRIKLLGNCQSDKISGCFSVLFHWKIDIASFYTTWVKSVNIKCSRRSCTHIRFREIERETKLQSGNRNIWIPPRCHIKYPYVPRYQYIWNAFPHATTSDSQVQT